ncbi:hypothetical protein [Deinococcus xianganensis]|uniref:Uncharacterized protein n=1 Tax=Deinococcus xianganensis TaxID=1507289 RepID=A0A6I4YD18_9DEIO|nr:hypothetical protein [Deinococcus xianganensis]MXV18868.1 hypothetical protein [Deinococcus xianganensis]
MTSRTQTDRLRRRNALWQQLRTTDPDAAGFEEALARLADLTGWDRARILAGLGLDGPARAATDRPAPDRPARRDG